MNRPIDTSVVMKNIDQVSRIMKDKEVSLVLQQANASNEVIEQAKLSGEKVIKINEPLMQNIDVKKKDKKISQNEKKTKDEKELKKIKKQRPKDLNKGRWLDIEG